MKWLKFIGVIILAIIGYELTFNIIVDPFFVPHIGMRPVLSGVTMFCFLYPATTWAHAKWIQQGKKYKK